ncbi:MAG: hypothetical protein FJW40_10315 [Acidobacteria bacterium]|nr:hypothetical protein [Acidobacteriota bacterium]
MKTIAVVLCLCAGAWAQNPPAKGVAKGTAGKAKKAAAQAAPVEPPKNARRISENVYLHTDAKGQAWQWRRTPFGWSKFPHDETRPADAQLPAGMVAEDDGDSVRFTKPTPFGIAKWTKKKDALDPDEQAVWEKTLAARK